MARKETQRKKHCEETFSLDNIESRLALVSDISWEKILRENLETETKPN